jgi:hypothetical protein
MISTAPLSFDRADEEVEGMIAQAPAGGKALRESS